MAAVAGPSTPTPRKLSAIPEEGQSTPHRPLRRVSTKRRPPPALLGDETPPTPGSSGGSTPKLELGTTEEQLVLFAEAKALYTSGMDSLRKGKKGVRLALPLFRQAYTLFAMELGRPDKAAKALQQVAWCTATLANRSKKERDWDAAMTGFEEARAIYRAIAEGARSPSKLAEARSKEAMALFQLGTVLAEVKDLTGATEVMKEASQLFASIPKDAEEAMCLCELANLLTRRDPTSALFFLKQALLIFLKLEDSYKEARALYAIGSLAASQARDYQAAFAYFVQARVIFRQRGDAADDANCSYQLGKLAVKGGQYSAAVAYFEEASTLYHRQQQAADEAWCLYRLALVLLELRNHDASSSLSMELPVDYLTEARTLFKEVGDLEAEASCSMRLGEILKDVDSAAAKSYLKEALELVDPERDAKTRRTTVMLQQLESKEPPPRAASAGAPAKAWWATEW